MNYTTMTVPALRAELATRGITAPSKAKKNTLVDLLTAADAAGADDVLTTVEFAAIFDTNARALRVVLRKLGLGVGKGSRYGLPRTLATTHADAIKAGLAA